VTGRVSVEVWKPPWAGEVEFAAVVALFRHGLAAKTPPEERTAVGARALFGEIVGVPKTGVLVARVPGGGIEGLLILRNEPPGARIVFVAVREPRKGTGTALVEALRAVAVQKKVGDLRATVPAMDARARKFFEKLGFRPAEGGAASGDTVELRLPIPPGEIA
jgi:GNAT superfamily N-acetyltransferase